MASYTDSMSYSRPLYRLIIFNFSPIWFQYEAQKTSEGETSHWCSPIRIRSNYWFTGNHIFTHTHLLIHLSKGIRYSFLQGNFFGYISPVSHRSPRSAFGFVLHFERFCFFFGARYLHTKFEQRARHLAGRLIGSFGV